MSDKAVLRQYGVDADFPQDVLRSLINTPRRRWMTLRELLAAQGNAAAPGS